MIKAFLSTLIFAFVLLCGQAQAVEFVYRIDSRPPDVIFRGGFSSHGNNRALIPHLRGESCTRTQSPDSIYIATAGSVEAANNVARAYLRNPNAPRMYRYRIRADSNFYYGWTSYNYVTRNTEETDGILENMMTLQNEYMALTSIPRENIQEAVEVTLNRENDQIVDGAGQSNADYVARSTQSNPGIIPGLQTPLESFRQRIVAIGALIIGCLSDRGVRRDGGRAATAYEPLFYDARPVLDSLTLQ